MHSAQGIGARVGARVRLFVQGLGGWYKCLVQELVEGFGVGIRV